jgi:hypothetical protein
MKNRKLKAIIPGSLAALVLLFACSKSYLNIPLTGQLAPATLANKIGVEALLVGAYSLLDGEGSNAGTGNGPWATAASNWVYGSVAGGDAHKGSDAGDQNLITPIESWNALPSNSYLDQVWQQRYDGVQRSNDAIRVMRLAKDMTPADTIQVTAEARFLRAHYHFELRKLFKMVPWIDETVTYSAGNFYVPNNTDIFPNIETDFMYAYNNLPETQSQVGRVNKWAAASYLAKTYMFEGKFSDAKALLTTIIASGKTSGGDSYKLVDHFADNFNPAKKNGPESVFAVQMNVNDGTGGANANTGDALNFPYGGGAQTSCCGFFQPSFSLANSFKVDGNGLPFLDGSFNNTDLKNDYGKTSNEAYTPDSTTPLDPRIDWTIGRRGIPFLDWGIMPGQDWIRDQANAGPYEGMKHMFYKSQVGTLTDASGWTNGFTANNVNIIRFADVLLWAAEAEAEVGSLDQATKYVNMVRARASDPTGFVQGSVANYKIGLYPTFPSQDYARKAIRFERKIELAMEGHRFFDLTRWGTGAAELNAYAAHEVNSNYLNIKGAVYTTGKSEYLPIPQAEIDLSVTGGKSVLTQNPGY